ncbi:NAD(+) diphosphatase [Terrabacter aerolatus]|uniref:NAD(+) diphosphatase n=1 Tax=Terrabacter aerolatus TaxID=422442 RepID=UPI0027D98F68|nr:NAD(+) diphosphatase [Terrabacter aerolatus]
MALTEETLADLALSRSSLDRVALERRRPDVLGELLGDARTWVVEVRGDRMQVTPGTAAPHGAGDDRSADDAATDDSLRLVLRAPEPADRDGLGLHLGRDTDGTAYVGIVTRGADGDADPAEDGWLTLRQAGEALAARDAGIFTTALALANWHATHRFCPRCGAPTVPVQAGWVRRCEREGSEHYPRTDPAVIMSVVDPDGRLLLGRGAQWPEGRFSVLAGFVEPGESFEAAVAREVAEEVGVTVDDVRYLGDQPWPFPSSVMIGFEATTRETALTIDPVEMAEARWVSRDEYRDLLRSGTIRTPSGISIAKRIIEHWLGQTVESVVPPGTGTAF